MQAGAQLPSQQAVEQAVQQAALIQKLIQQEVEKKVKEHLQDLNLEDRVGDREDAAPANKGGRDQVHRCLVALLKMAIKAKVAKIDCGTLKLHTLWLGSDHPHNHAQMKRSLAE